MQRTRGPIAREIVLVGGGHSHALVLRRFGMQPIPGVRLTLVSNVTHTPYSGMLPGYIAGAYTYDEAHIDLRKLAIFAGARFIRAEVNGISAKKKEIYSSSRPALRYDLLSLDIGSSPRSEMIQGAREFAIPVKPVPNFLNRWADIRDYSEQNPAQEVSIAIVGAGAAGVEIALAIASRLKTANIRLSLFDGGGDILSTHNSSVRKKLRRALERHSISLHLDARIKSVTQNNLELTTGESFSAEHVLLLTTASAPDWLRETDLALTDDGFIRVTQALQSVDNPSVFAAGDIATMEPEARAKSGVYAVRQAPYLAENLVRALADKPLHEYKPQRKFLALIGTSDSTAVASRGWLTFHGRAMWRLKEYIDRKFMNQFHQLPQMESATKSLSGITPTPRSLARSEFSKEVHALAQRSRIRCAGCGAKTASPVLSAALRRVREQSPAAELEKLDDASILSVNKDSQVLQTVDYLSQLQSDLYLFGQIAVYHCCNDIFAMGATPTTVLALVLTPFNAQSIAEEDIFQLLSGSCLALEQLGATLVGGHTAEAAQTGLGFTCNGQTQHRLLSKGGMQAGDVLILTKALGTGALFAAEMRMKSKGRWIDEAIASMLQANCGLAECLRQHAVHAATDVSGFGLLGHLVEMLDASDTSAELQLDALPLLDGALEVTQAGVVSSLHASNKQLEHVVENYLAHQSDASYSLLFDPQTSGGLLLSLPQERARQCIEALSGLGFSNACVVGEVLERGSSNQGKVRIR